MTPGTQSVGPSTTTRQPPLNDPSYLSPTVSVIIPVFDHAPQLRTCLLALQQQSYSRSRYEVIVVDNGSSDELDHAAAGFTNLRIVFESRPGSYAARNRGISEARGEILAFTDADCVPDPNWISEGVKVLMSHSDTVVVGGHVSIFPQDSDQMTSTELHQRICAFPQQRYVEQLNFAATANMFTYRHTFNETGRFDDRLLSGGDWEWGQRVRGRKLGSMVYAKTARVRHPAKRSFCDLAAKYQRVIGGLFQLSRQGKYRLAPFLLRRCLLTPWMRWMSYRSRPELRSHTDWWRLLLIELALIAVFAREMLRLACGGKPHRK